MQQQREDGSRQEGRAPVQIEDQIDAMGWGRFQYIAAAAFVLFIISDGMELIITNITFRAMPRDEWGMDDTMRGQLISMSFIGFVVGAVVGGYAGDTFGRKSMLYVHTAIFVPFTTFSALSQNQYQLMISRLFVGLSMGIVLPTSVSFMSELCPTFVRGRLITALPSIAFCGGQVIILCVGIALIEAYGENNSDSSWWRWMMFAGVIPDVLALILVHLFLPESPRFLLVQGRHDEVDKAIRLVAQINDAEDKLIDGGRVSEARDENQGLDRVMELCVPPLRDTMAFICVAWCLLSIPLFGQGFMYPIILEKQFNVSSKTQFVMLITFAAADILGVLACFLVLDNVSVGRKITIMVFSVCTLIASFVASTCSGMSLWWVHGSHMLFRIFCAAPYEIMYVYCAELLPTTHRNQGLSIGNASTKFVGGALLPIFITILLSMDDPSDAASTAFIGFGAASAAAFCSMMCYGRETVGRKMLDVSTDVPAMAQEDNGYKPLD